MPRSEGSGERTKRGTDRNATPDTDSGYTFRNERIFPKQGIRPTMNLHFAKEVGIFNYILRRMAWRMGKAPSTITLPTGSRFPLPREKFFASDVFVTEANVDWNSEYILASYLKSLPTKGDFLDVGAHIGYYSALLSPLCSRVTAFEPDSRNHPYLKETAKDLSNVKIVAKAVSNQNGSTGFSDSDESSVSHMIVPEESGDGNATVVETITIDDFVDKEALRPAAVKIDIEGFDILALWGALSTARVHQPVFLVEYNLEEGRPNTWKGLEEFLDVSGYLIFAVSRRPKGLFGYSYSLDGRAVSDLPGLSVKMIFLAPQSTCGWFEDLSRGMGVWGRESLRPEGVAAFLAGIGKS
ncbi:MAG: FkbM family methyltransferase [Akkermansiaceae bacterium]|nr:FkbM family methyltransferase [Akkermansiaceae bacterium]